MSGEDDTFDEDEDEYAEPAAPASSPKMSRDVLDYVARSIVDHPDAVEIDAEPGRRGVNLRLHVAPDDMGKVIGRRGRVAQAIRTVVRAAGAREGVEAQVDIVD